MACLFSMNYAQTKPIASKENNMNSGESQSVILAENIWGFDSER